MEYKKTGAQIALRLDPGEEIVSSLTELARTLSLQAGSVVGLGASNDVTLGIFSVADKEYSSVRYQGDFEIASLLGSFSRKDGEPYLHLHMTIGNPREGSVHCGHLNRAVVSATCELFITEFPAPLHRRFDPEIGLNLLQF